MGKRVQWAALKGEAVGGRLLQGFSPLLCCSGGGGPIQWEGLWVREPRSGKRPELGPKNPRLPRAPASSNPPFLSATLSGPSDGAWKKPGEGFQSNNPPSRCSADSCLSGKTHPISASSFSWHICWPIQPWTPPDFKEK